MCLENHLEFAWVNHSSYPFYSTEPYYGIRPTLGPANTFLPGQDGRILQMTPNRLVITYTASRVIEGVTGKYFRSGMVDVRTRPGRKNRILIQSNRTLTPVQASPKRRHEKNWVPFKYASRVHFIIDINPMFVVKPTEMFESSGLRQFVTFVSNTTVKSTPWKYGELRGGTNAVYLNDKGVFVAIFHSVGTVPGSLTTTYFMGAFTFSGAPPFELLAVSETPIVHYELYGGPTFNFYRRKATSNYIVFPMSLFKSKNKSRLFVSLGSQDRHGWLAEIEIDRLLASLVPVHY
jgi:predicted GH43/DUF377 family glycosyl hydrolase